MPITIRELHRAKVQSCYHAVLPVLCYFALCLPGAGIAGDRRASAIAPVVLIVAFATCAFVFAFAHVLLLFHLVAWLSLKVPRGAFPLGIAILVLREDMVAGVMGMLTFGLGSDRVAFRRGDSQRCLPDEAARSGSKPSRAKTDPSCRMTSPLLALFTRSLREDTRGRMTYFARGGLAAFTLLLTVGTTIGSRWKGAPGLEFFAVIVTLQAVCVTIAGLGYFASAVTEEKEDMTLGLLRMTNLTRSRSCSANRRAACAARCCCSR